MNSLTEIPKPSRVLLATAVAVGVLSIVYVTARIWLESRIERLIILPATLADVTPTIADLPYRDIVMPGDDRTLHAWIVEAPQNVLLKRSVLVFHGNAAAISELIPLQAFFYREGVTSMVFDYSGFGNSTGIPSLKNLSEDALTAVREFVHQTPPGSSRYLLGISLGGAILMEVASQVQDSFSGIVLLSTFASGRETILRTGLVPNSLSWLLPDRLNVVTAASQVDLPLLIVHGVNDRWVPYSDAERIVDAAKPSKGVARLLNAGHDRNELMEEGGEAIVDFMTRHLRSGGASALEGRGERP